MPSDEDLKLAFDEGCSDDKGLQEHAWKWNILLATPTTLPLILRLFGSIDPLDTYKIKPVVPLIFSLADFGLGRPSSSRAELSQVRKFPRFVPK